MLESIKIHGESPCYIGSRGLQWLCVNRAWVIIKVHFVKVYCFQSFAALTFILSFVVQNVNFRIFFTTLLFIAVVCHTSLFASFSLIVLGNLPEFRRRLLRLAENLTVDVDAQISLFEVMLFDYLRWYTQDSENQISSAFCHCFFWLFNITWNFSFP